ncbi:MAG: Rid family detoxifying hydrolase [Chitinophagales bacterium]
MKKQIVQTSDGQTPIGPYSQAVISGDMIFISGVVGRDPASGNVITADIKSETKRAMQNLKSILTAGGIDFSHVVKTTIFLTDLKNFAAMNEVYGSYFIGEYPARETVQVSALPLGANVEISMIAMK